MSWHDNPNPNQVVRSGAWRIGVWIIVILIFFSLIGAGMWAFGVFTSPIKGKGDAYKTKNSGTNRIIAQERFEDMYQDVLAADRRIEAMQEAVKADPSAVNRTNLNGAINYCIEVVADYNAESRKYTAEEFRATDLPHQIDNLDPTTDCKGDQ